jgi:hypothetical protein
VSFKQKVYGATPLQSSLDTASLAAAWFCPPIFSAGHGKPPRVHPRFHIHFTSSFAKYGRTMVERWFREAHRQAHSTRQLRQRGLPYGHHLRLPRRLLSALPTRPSRRFEGPLCISEAIQLALAPERAVGDAELKCSLAQGATLGDYPSYVLSFCRSKRRSFLRSNFTRRRRTAGRWALIRDCF